MNQKYSQAHTVMSTTQQGLKIRREKCKVRNFNTSINDSQISLSNSRYVFKRPSGNQPVICIRFMKC
jgi:hypothetical protein